MDAYQRKVVMEQQLKGIDRRIEYLQLRIEESSAELAALVESRERLRSLQSTESVSDRC